MHLRPRYFLLLASVLLLAAGMHAQSKAAVYAPDHQELELAVTYTADYSNLVPTQTFWQQGGSVELSAQVYRGFGLAANVTGTETSNAAGSGVSLNLVTATFGPRYAYNHAMGAEQKRSFSIFGQGLVGQAWGFDSDFPSTSGVQTDANSLAFQLGGGVDLGLARHLGVRLFQADWLRTELPNGTTNVQNNLRLAAGVVFRFPQHL